MIISEAHKQIIRHSLGIDGLRWYDIHKLEEEPYRNYFATSKETKDFLLLQDLVEKGLMCENDKKQFEYRVFHVTDEGVKIAKQSALDKIKESRPTRSKRRYQCYLHSESDESFFEWLKNGYWDEMRKQYQV